LTNQFTGREGSADAPAATVNLGRNAIRVSAGPRDRVSYNAVNLFLAVVIDTTDSNLKIPILVQTVKA
jgi:hypothetical protein